MDSPPPVIMQSENTSTNPRYSSKPTPVCRRGSSASQSSLPALPSFKPHGPKRGYNQSSGSEEDEEVDEDYAPSSINSSRKRRRPVPSSLQIPSSAQSNTFVSSNTHSSPSLSRSASKSTSFPNTPQSPTAYKKYSSSSSSLSLSSGQSHRRSKQPTILSTIGCANASGACQFCGIRKTGQWRRGPLGQRTLCNACGINWCKKVKAEMKGRGCSLEEAERIVGDDGSKFRKVLLVGSAGEEEESD
jgi:hypothetical protein